ncbi:hypothetical protein V5799_027432 [Amblyomma americanum]|uniref:Secreted protein n=1 Tax=Amblyomma americanum TaxID=6943 RepID=A0AAQ4DFR2_AMBAM
MHANPLVCLVQLIGVLLLFPPRSYSPSSPASTIGSNLLEHRAYYVPAAVYDKEFQRGHPVISTMIAVPNISDKLVALRASPEYIRPGHHAPRAQGHGTSSTMHANPFVSLVQLIGVLLLFPPRSYSPSSPASTIGSNLLEHRAYYVPAAVHDKGFQRGLPVKSTMISGPNISDTVAALRASPEYKART